MKDLIERWGPLAFSVAALLVALLYNVNNDRKIAARDKVHAETLGYIKKSIEVLERESERQKRVIQSWQNWSVAVYERLDGSRIQLPNPPVQEIDK